jgi:hypothetical protein
MAARRSPAAHRAARNRLQASPSVGLQAPTTSSQDVRFTAWEDGGLLLSVSDDPKGEVLTGPETVAHTAGCGWEQPRVVAVARGCLRLLQRRPSSASSRLTETSVRRHEPGTVWLPCASELQGGTRALCLQNRRGQIAELTAPVSSATLALQTLRSTHWRNAGIAARDRDHRVAVLHLVRTSSAARDRPGCCSVYVSIAPVRAGRGRPRSGGVRGRVPPWSAAANSCQEGRSKCAGVHLAGLNSDAKLPTGPRCVSFSGFTIELMLLM